MERYKILSEEGIEAIHENTMRIMKEIGVVMPEDHAKETLLAAGCTVEGDLVKFPREVVEAAIESAPNSYMLHARDESKNVPISCERSAYAGPYGSPFVLDLDNGWRRSTMQDFINIVKIVDKCDYIDIQSHISCEPGDVEEKKRPLEMVYNTMRNSVKPLMTSIYGYENSMRTIELASLAFGGLEAIKDKPIVASIPCTLTPLSYDPAQLGAIRAYAETGQVQLINSLSIAGMTTPCTIAGLISVQNAEVLAGITYAQLVNPGCPVVYSASGSCGDMGSGLLSIGAPEDIVVSLVNGQLTKKYQIPCRISGALSDSKSLDIQAAYESALTMVAAQMSGGNFILHSAGIIDTYNCTSYEKIIMDNEILGYMRRIDRGVNFDEESLAFDVIEEVGPQGTFLAEDHTFEHFRDEFYKPTLSERSAYDRWVEAGSQTADVRANKIWKKILADNPDPCIDAALDAEMAAYVKKYNG